MTSHRDYLPMKALSKLYFDQEQTTLYKCMNCFGIHVLAKGLMLFSQIGFGLYTIQVWPAQYIQVWLAQYIPIWPAQYIPVWPAQYIPVWPAQYIQVWPVQYIHVWPAQYIQVWPAQYIPV